MRYIHTHTVFRPKLSSHLSITSQQIGRLVTKNQNTLTPNRQKNTRIIAQKATKQTVKPCSGRDSLLALSLNMVLSAPILSLVYNAALGNVQ